MTKTASIFKSTSEIDSEIAIKLVSHVDILSATYLERKCYLFTPVNKKEELSPAICSTSGQNAPSHLIKNKARHK